MKKLLVILLSLLCVLSLTACGGSKDDTAEGEKVYHVGVIQLLEHEALNLATDGFKDYLEEKLGDKVVVDVKYGNADKSTMASIANTFVSNDYDLILGNATDALLAARGATDTIPVLGTSVTDFADALKLELVDGATGVNVSGTSDGVSPESYVSCLLELVPEAKKVAMLYNSAESNSEVQIKGFIDAMAKANSAVECVRVPFDEPAQIQNVVQAALANDDIDAMYIPTDNAAADSMPVIQNETSKYNLPVICGESGMCGKGGLATVSISYYNIGKVAGEMAYDILVNGADVSKIAIGYDLEPVKMYNADYAKLIGFEMIEGYEAIAKAE